MSHPFGYDFLGGHDHIHKIHGIGIFTYMNGWFLWDQCIGLYTTHGSHMGKTQTPMLNREVYDPPTGVWPSRLWEFYETTVWMKLIRSFSRWWQLKYFSLFHAYFGKWSNLTSIFFKWVGSTTNQVFFVGPIFVGWAIWDVFFQRNIRLKKPSKEVKFDLGHWW